MEKTLVADNPDRKLLTSPNYNYVYIKDSGFFMRWGREIKDDPQFSPLGPEILDLEISSGGDCLGRCPFCYKNNGGAQDTCNMPFYHFKAIFDKMPKILTQIAFGIMNIYTNSAFFDMMKYAREHGVVPNYTCHGLDVDDNAAKKTAELCGAVAVSIVKKEKTFEAIKRFLENGMKQINVHYMLSEETYGRAFKILDEIAEDSELRKLNAVVFLQYKSKGRNTHKFHPVLDINKYEKLMRHCEERKIGYGFDSCSTPMFVETLHTREDPTSQMLKVFSEPCESGLFSAYINCMGRFFPCSFGENVEWNFYEGLDVLNCENFLKDIWFNPRLVDWRKKLMNNNRECPIYDLSVGKK